MFDNHTREKNFKYVFECLKFATLSQILPQCTLSNTFLFLKYIYTHSFALFCYLKKKRIGYIGTRIYKIFIIIIPNFRQLLHTVYSIQRCITSVQDSFTEVLPSVCNTCAFCCLPSLSRYKGA